jgi:hypothetical protein
VERSVCIEDGYLDLVQCDGRLYELVVVWVLCSRRQGKEERRQDSTAIILFSEIRRREGEKEREM